MIIILVFKNLRKFKFTKFESNKVRNMTKFNVRDLEIIKNAKISSSTLKRQLGSMLESAVNYRAVVESLNRETGEYRIVLQGTLDTRDI